MATVLHFQTEWELLHYHMRMIEKSFFNDVDNKDQDEKRNRKTQFRVEQKNRLRRNKAEKNKTKVHTFLLCCRRTRFFCKNVSRMIAEKMFPELPPLGPRYAIF